MEEKVMFLVKPDQKSSEGVYILLGNHGVISSFWAPADSDLFRKIVEESVWEKGKTSDDVNKT